MAPRSIELLPIVALITLLLVADFSPLRAAAKTHGNVLPENTISISFDLARQSLTATAKINLPAATPLTLACGNLEISGAVLERTGHTPLSMKPSSGNALVVPAADMDQTVYISWSLTVPANAGGDNLISSEGITLAGLWHPLPDIDMTYRLEALLPDTFIGISEGESLTPNKNKGNQQYLSSAFPYPLRGIHFVAGPYTVKQRTLANGVTLATFFFQEDSSLADAYLDNATSYILRYEKLIAPFPYKRYSIVENRLPTGYGMPTFTLLGQAVVRLPFIKDTSLGHEILHSWFGNSVHVSESNGNWCEGLTTYLADHLYAEEQGDGAEYRKQQLQRYASYVPRDNTLSLRAFTNASDAQPMARHIRAVGYDKSAMLFHMLRQRLGDKLFFEGLRLFYQKMRFKQAGWDDIEESFAAVSKQDLALFFEQWLTRPDIPKYIIDTVDVSQLEGRSVLTFTVHQQSVEPYEFDLPVMISTLTGDDRQTIKIRERGKEVKITVDDLPVAMTLDPDYDLMRTLRPEEEAPTWSRFMGSGTKTVVLPPAEMAATYAPLLPMLEDMGATTVTADKLEGQSLENGSYVFLGSSPQSLSLFADPGHAVSGFTLDIRKNPLAPDQVMALIASSSPAESAAVVRKLGHYGKYSFLSFGNGRLQDKRIAKTTRGLRVDLFKGPEGVRVPDIRSFAEISSEIRQSQVVYVGEVHTDMGVHILQLQVLQAMYHDDPDLAIGMEMFPRYVQEELDGYINGVIPTEQEFLKKSGYYTVWGYDYRLYREIIGYAKRHGIPIVGLNIDKAVVSQIFQDGNLDGLDEMQREQIPAERNLDLPGYRERLALAFAAHDSQNFDGEKLKGFVQAQSIWDESMAESIVSYLRDHPGRRMLVIAGNGHVYKDTGIPPRVARRLNVPQTVLSSISYGNTGQEEGFRMDYLLYTQAVELEPAPKVGVVLDVEGNAEEPRGTRVRVIKISPHGKGGEAGLREKDIILAVDNVAVHDISDIKIALLDKHPGDKAQLKVLREHNLLPDKELELAIELTGPTGMEGMPPTHPK